MLHRVRVIAYERNHTGREVTITKHAMLDLSEIEYMESDDVSGYDNVTIVRLRSGKEITVTSTIGELAEAMKTREGPHG